MKINGQDAGLFVVATGVEGIVVSTKSAQRLGLSSLAQISVDTAEGPVKSDLFEVARIDVGEAWLGRMLVSALDLSDLSEKSGVEISGLLGSGLLEHLPFALDMRDGTLTFYSRAHFTPAPGEGLRLLMLDGAHIPAIETTIAGQTQALLQIDTAQEPSLTIQPYFTRAQGGPSPQHYFSRNILGPGGFHVWAQWALKDVMVGGHSCGSQPAWMDMK
ncbi:MAG TPA: retropepsin-like aspartic protease, partial [Humisphaera sp.]|nr:retropepsin-like aspartic protease [Humisphaera sp.]